MKQERIRVADREYLIYFGYNPETRTTTCSVHAGAFNSTSEQKQLVAIGRVSRHQNDSDNRPRARLLAMSRAASELFPEDRKSRADFFNRAVENLRLRIPKKSYSNI